MNTTRRDFLKIGAGAVAAASGVLANSKEVSSPTESGERAAAAGEAGDMIYRGFGSTAAQISAIGGGGHHFGDLPTFDGGGQTIHRGVRPGGIFFDKRLGD